MLRFAEEILLLALDEKTGRLHALPERALEFALAGAVLAELAFMERLDTDTTQVFVKDFENMGDPVLDLALACLPKNEPKLTIQKALARIALKAGQLKELIFAELVRKGILKQTQQSYLWVLHERRYPVVDNREEREVRARIRDIILTPGAIPDPRDVVLIGLMDACDLDHFVFTPQELDRSAERIKLICKMDFIVQALARAIGEIQQAILEVIAYSGM
ncbi:MAG TPA: GPP34 family phosphoprotein [Opitutales bacterium]|jgi:Golgi phosphoprotein 3|nr:GPP34 family phosphoprotein [Opitutales bacterium]